MGGAAAAADALQVSAAEAEAAGEAPDADIPAGAEAVQKTPGADIPAGAEAEPLPQDADIPAGAEPQLPDVCGDADGQKPHNRQPLLLQSTTFLHSSSFFTPFHFFDCISHHEGVYNH